jgi:oligopeptide/dipeptide ABC transporter ATP-binding protein
MIALALACNPLLLIADEPTTGLDVTTQDAVMALIRDLARDRGLATLFITHDLALASESCDRISVMHAGHIVETAPTAELFRHPGHPYTAQLIRSTPSAEMALEELASIPGNLPDLRRMDLPACRFSERCSRAIPQCRSGPLTMAAPEAGRRIWCCNPL